MRTPSYFLFRPENPHQLRLQYGQLIERVKTKFYRLTLPLFEGTPCLQEMEPNLYVYRKERISTMEWDLDQGPVSLLAGDFKAVIHKLTPRPLRKWFRNARNLLTLSLLMDDTEMEGFLSDLPAGEKEKVLQFRQDAERFHKTLNHTAGRAMRHTILFSEAIRILLLKSIRAAGRIPHKLSIRKVVQYVQPHAISCFHHSLTLAGKWLLKLCCAVSRRN